MSSTPAPLADVWQRIEGRVSCSATKTDFESSAAKPTGRDERTKAGPH
jgi:hypothetical protein